MYVAALSICPSYRTAHALPLSSCTADLEDFLPPQQAAEAFVYLDIDGNGRISAGEVRESVLKIFQVGAPGRCSC